MGGGIGYCTVHLLVMPAVVREARAHFNCPTWRGQNSKICWVSDRDISVG
jgi:hypothetical protein